MGEIHTYRVTGKGVPSSDANVVIGDKVPDVRITERHRLATTENSTAGLMQASSS